MSSPFVLSPLALWNKIFGTGLKMAVETHIESPPLPTASVPSTIVRQTTQRDDFDDADEKVTAPRAEPRKITPDSGPRARRHTTQPPRVLPPDPSDADY